ncbi:MAG: ribosome maturation factor RimM [Burkholderiales bacterium]
MAAVAGMALAGMEDRQSRLVVMAKVLGPFGVRGWMKIQHYTDEPDSLARYPKWWLRIGDEWREYELAESERHGGHMVARIAGFASREEVASLSGAQVAVKRSDLPRAKKGEFYRDDLVGMAVVNLSGEALGEVSEIFENGAHPILRVAFDGGERLLPFIPQVVSEIDLEGSLIRVDWGADW